MNRKNRPADFVIQMRDWQENPTFYQTVEHPRIGPNCRFHPDGVVSAGAVKLTTVPLGQWVHVEMLVQLGTNDPKTFDLTLTTPGEPPRPFKVPYAARGDRRSHRRRRHPGPPSPQRLPAGVHGQVHARTEKPCGQTPVIFALWARLFGQARRVRYAVATGGDASWRLGSRRRRSHAGPNRRRGRATDRRQAASPKRAPKRE